jgi:dihydrofolate synthase/folylpolyglutamate synthase
VRDDPVTWLYGLQTFGVKLGLDGIRALLHLLDRPQSAAPSVLVGGTNGKGSVAAMLDAMLQAHGRRTGLYTSPHLVRPNERIRIGGRDIDAAELDRTLDLVRAACERGLGSGALSAQPSFFEVMTAAAMTAFRAAGIDAAVLEVGLGGRLDATNAMDPIVSAIVTVDLDHVATLGGTLAAIAGEKAGIVRAGRVLVSGVAQPVALAVLRERCSASKATFLDARAAVGFEERPGGAFVLRSASARYEDLRLPLAGAHQRDNARVAVATLEAIAAATGFAVDPAAVRRGLAAVRWPGRLQLVPGRPPVLLDGAHNPQGAEALAAELAVRSAAGQPRPVLVFAAMKDKDIAGLIAPLLPHVAHVVATQPGVDRAVDPETLAATIRGAGAGAEPAPSPAEALARARELAGGDGLVLVAGSLYLVGAVLALLEGRDAPGPVPM